MGTVGFFDKIVIKYYTNKICMASRKFKTMYHVFRTLANIFPNIYYQVDWYQILEETTHKKWLEPDMIFLVSVVFQERTNRMNSQIE